jgi:hypothetical protein
VKTLILTGAESSMHELLDITIPSKQKYAALHGYDFMSVRSFTSDLTCGFTEKNIGFLRALLAFKLLRFYNNVMWLDADSIITNFTYTIDAFIQSNACFIASYDWLHYSQFSTGNFIIRKTVHTQQLFNMFIEVSKKYINNVMAEQATLNEICALTNDANYFNILDHKYLNSVPGFLVETETWKNDNNRSGIISPWTTDSFIAHFTGTSNSERIHLIKTNALGI